MTTSNDSDDFGSARELKHAGVAPLPPPGREVPSPYSPGYFWLLAVFALALTVGLIYGFWQLSQVRAPPEPKPVPTVPRGAASDVPSP